ncbi:unnamed protein product [Haemonchus placei]|uniref:Pec_lyase_N domain-containing protein n=1 Tax=Haemonchus placei TaxID=6290 RepID=A0A0N4WW61_HAEPC|nr:unnamed protein product [Haemonchus placei]
MAYSIYAILTLLFLLGREVETKPLAQLFENLMKKHTEIKNQQLMQFISKAVPYGIDPPNPKIAEFFNDEVAAESRQKRREESIPTDEPISQRWLFALDLMTKPSCVWMDINAMLTFVHSDLNEFHSKHFIVICPLRGKRLAFNFGGGEGKAKRIGMAKQREEPGCIHIVICHLPSI